MMRVMLKIQFKPLYRMYQVSYFIWCRFKYLYTYNIDNYYKAQNIQPIDKKKKCTIVIICKVDDTYSL